MIRNRPKDSPVRFLTPTDVQTGPHEFRPMKRFFNRGRCMHCYIHEVFHPINGYVTSRPWRDFSLPGSPKATSRGGWRIEV
jgi:hypothetical protein